MERNEHLTAFLFNSRSQQHGSQLVNFLNFFKIKKRNTPTTSELRGTDDFSPNKTEQNREAPKKSHPDLSCTHRSIMEIWNKIGATPCTIEAGTIFYSGIRSKSPIVEIHELLKNRNNLWMSQSAFYAGGYCYRDSSPTTYFALLKFRVTQATPLLEFPNAFHPATAFFEYTETESGFEVDYSSPPRYQWFKHGQADHHIDVYFRDIVRNGNFQVDPIGHIRRAAKHELGATPGEIIELYIADFSTIEIIDWILPPATKQEYIKLIGPNHTNAASVLFS